MKLRRIDAARDIADIVAKSGNKVFLNADSLLLNLLGDADEKFELVEPAGVDFCILELPSRERHKKGRTSYDPHDCRVHHQKG
jgi:hypothetical protein